MKVINQINNEQVGWLEITYLSIRLRICRGNKGTLFVLRKKIHQSYSINLNNLLKAFKVLY